MNFINLIKETITTRTGKIAITAVILLVIIYFIVRTPARVIETTKVTRSNYQHVLLTDGITRVKEKFTIFSPVNGVLRRIQKNIGDSVSKGELIAIVDWDIGRKIVSPINGKILKIYRESEGPVSMQEKLLDIGNTEQMALVVKVLTEDMKDLDVNDSVEISGFTDQIIMGKVYKIEPTAITEISSLGVEEQKVPVWIDFPIPKEMGEGYKLDAKIILFESPDSLIIPSSALVRDGHGWIVYVDSKNRARKRGIEFAHQSEGKIQIINGLVENEEVILYPGEDMKDGIKIKVE